MSQDQRVEGLIGAPRRYIFNDADMQRFRQSQAKEELLRVTEAMGKACSSCSLYVYNPEDPLNGLTPSIASLHGSLTGMLQWLLDFPPSNRSQARFGNPMFRMWHKRLVERSVNVVYTILRVQKEYPGRGNFNKEVLQSASKRGLAAIDQVKEIESITEQNDRDIVIELIAYFQAAFGHEVRLDYGTGHECSFQVFLFVLCKLGCFGSTTDVPPSAEHLKATTISIWSAYLSLTRQVQTDYMLEPAGSHGVWGLDDYHCLPFYFGACQMQSDGLDYRPDSIHDNSLLERERDSLLYFGCIRYIKSLKQGAPFYEHSPMLNDISNLLSWAKVASGLLRLFEGEVLDKRQVVQHFVFKNLFTADWNPSQTYGQKAPSETFRSLAVAVPLARTPKADCEGGESDMAPTKAPWAKN